MVRWKPTVKRQQCFHDGTAPVCPELGRLCQRISESCASLNDLLHFCRRVCTGAEYPCEAALSAIPLCTARHAAISNPVAMTPLSRAVGKQLRIESVLLLYAAGHVQTVCDVVPNLSLAVNLRTPLTDQGPLLVKQNTLASTNPAHGRSCAAGSCVSTDATTANSGGVDQRSTTSASSMSSATKEHERDHCCFSSSRCVPLSTLNMHRKWLLQ